MKNVRTSPIWKMKDVEFTKIIQQSDTYTEILAHFGLMNRGSNHVTLKKRIKELGLTFVSNPHKVFKPKRVIQFYLRKNSIIPSMSHFKGRLIKEGLLENKCSKCGVKNIWKGEPLSLHLDHINGNPSDNRLTNLGLLCPNCHSQTNTYCGKNKRIPKKPCKNCYKPITRNNKSGLCKPCYLNYLKVHGIKSKRKGKPSKEELSKLIESLPMTQIGKQYKVSDNAIRKWAIEYGIELPKNRLGYWSKLKNTIPVPPKKELNELSKYMPVPEIAKRYCVNDSTIHKWFRQHSITGPGSRYWAKKRWKDKGS